MHSIRRRVPHPRTSQAAARPATPSRPTGVRYDDFVRAVRRYKAVALLRLLAAASVDQWRRLPNRLVDPTDPIKPWAVSLVAREALAGITATERERPTAAVLPFLDGLVHELEDPLLLDGPPASLLDGVAGGFFLRTGYQQFPYQQPILGDTARMRPMLKRPFPRPRYKVLSDAVVAELLGADVDVYTDLAPFFLAAVMSNSGQFNPAWLDLPHFAPVRERVSTEQILRVYTTRLSAPAAELRRAARATRNSRPELRQHDFNPLVDRPFIVLADGTGLAPQPKFVTGRFTLAALYYAGVAAYGNDFATDLGKLNEEYVIEQLDQLAAFGAVVSGEIEYEKSKFSTDGFVVLPDQVLLVEVKSRRPALDMRLDAVSYTNLLGKDISRAQDQLRTTYDLWRGGLPAFAHLPTDARAVRGLIVVPEPLYLANHSMFEQALRQMPFPTAVISFTELEQLVAAAVAERSGRVFADLTTQSPFLSADASATLSAARTRTGIQTPRNAILDAVLAENIIRPGQGQYRAIRDLDPFKCGHPHA